MEIIISAVIVLILVALSATFSGLNIALMALNVGDLSRKAKTGDKDAQRVLPLRKNTHRMLTTILLSNVATISATSLILNQYFGGWIAGFTSTILIVIFGEILPQALFSKKPLAYGGKLAPFLSIIMVIAYPVAKPLEKILDLVLGDDNVPRELEGRKELRILLSEHREDDAMSELDDDEAEIAQSAIMLSEKSVRDIMTPIKKVYSLTPETQLTGEKIDELKHKAYSRIPIFNREMTICFGVLLMKDLVDIDFDEKSHRVSELRLHPTKTIGPRTALDTTFRKFIGRHSHLMPVEENGKIIGIITIEDLIEEVIGHEIIDETDHRKNRT